MVTRNKKINKWASETQQIIYEQSNFCMCNCMIKFLNMFIDKFSSDITLKEKINLCRINITNNGEVNNRCLPEAPKLIR